MANPPYRFEAFVETQAVLCRRLWSARHSQLRPREIAHGDSRNTLSGRGREACTPVRGTEVLVEEGFSRPNLVRNRREPCRPRGVELDAFSNSFREQHP